MEGKSEKEVGERKKVKKKKKVKIGNLFFISWFWLTQTTAEPCFGKNMTVFPSNGKGV